jgi:hypothetical protein
MTREEVVLKLAARRRQARSLRKKLNIAKLARKECTREGVGIPRKMRGAGWILYNLTKQGGQFSKQFLDELPGLKRKAKDFKVSNLCAFEHI